MVGIGGVSMSPLAEILCSMGLKVTGSDMNDGEAVERLRGLGITVKIGHAAENISGAGFVIRTAAARDDNVEIRAARDMGIPVYERAEAWGYIMRKYKDAICVAGTHGKTTTTSMVTHILLEAETDPTVMIGGTLPALSSGYRVGGGDVIVLESCEYYNSFHSFFPTVAVILNVDADHLDFFKDLDDVKASFRSFASLVPDDGFVVCNYDDANTMDALRPLGRELFTFGSGEGARVRADNITFSSGCAAFDVVYDNAVYCSVALSVPGRHNMLNALAAASSAIALGLPGGAVARGLAAFHGVRRRFEYKGSFSGARIYDDYAHHPSELRALLDMVETLDYSRVILAFQPHTYTRTHELFDEFAEQLRRPDILCLAEIYAAREKNTLGISSADLAKAVPGAEYCPSFAEIEQSLRGIAREGDIILTVGAGDIYRVGESLSMLDTVTK